MDTSSIADADGLTNPSFSYTWLADDDLSTPEAFLRGGGFRGEYEVSPGDAGLTLIVQVHFNDDKGNPESFKVQATSVVAATVPAAPGDLSASLGDPGELDLSWSAPACDRPCWISIDNTSGVGDGGSDIIGYTV